MDTPIKINQEEVYTTEEAQQYLKVSNSTLMRMIKKGLIYGAKVGKQYRILGKELLRVVSPELEDKIGIIYNKGRRWIHDEKPLTKKKKLDSAPPKSEPESL